MTQNTLKRKSTRPFTVVVGVDFSDLSDLAIKTALTLSGVSGDGHVHLVHAMTLPEVVPELADVRNDVALELAQVREKIATLVPTKSLPKGTALTVHVAAGTPQDIVNQVARECGAELVVVGTHGRGGLRRALFGSVAEQVTRHAPCSVLAVRVREPTAEEQIEPPCADCAKVAAGGDPGHVSCVRHARHPIQAHTYSELPEAFGGGWMSFQPPA